MTCIVGYIAKNKVYIGADSIGSNGYTKEKRKDVKVFKVGEFLLGCTSSFRMIQLLQFKLKLPKIKVDIFEYMCTSFVDAARKCFKDGGFLEVDNQVDTGGHFLVGYKSRLFAIGTDFQVAEVVDKYQACGVGESIALGAMYALRKTKLSPKKRIKAALKASAHHSVGVGKPFVVKHTQ